MVAKNFLWYLVVPLLRCAVVGHAGGHGVSPLDALSRSRSGVARRWLAAPESKLSGEAPHMGMFTRTQGMGLAALIMAGSIFLSRFMGLVRDKVISFHFGATAEADIYFAAFVVPDFLNYLLAGGYFSITLIPLLAASFEQDEQAGWRFF